MSKYLTTTMLKRDGEGRKRQLIAQRFHDDEKKRKFNKVKC